LKTHKPETSQKKSAPADIKYPTETAGDVDREKNNNLSMRNFATFLLLVVIIS
jgi:hypothetical protein